MPSPAPPLPHAVAAALVAVALAAACASPPRPAPGAEPMRENRASTAQPAPDPTLHGTVQGERAVPPLERVTARLARAPDGRLTVVDVLSPELTPTQREELQRGLEQGEWRPEGTPAPGAEPWIQTLIHGQR
jgi:hypothetical protein